MFLKISQYSKENTCATVSFLIKRQSCNFIKKETLAQLFSCEFCEVFKNTVFQEHLWTTASIVRNDRALVCNDKVITYNFSSLETNFLFYYKPHLPGLYFSYFTRTFFRDPPSLLNLKALRDLDSFISLGTKSHIFGPG